jgi:hypothetical protein
MKKIYIAGPMTGLPEFNKPAFFELAAKLEEQGHIVLNPAILPSGLEWHEYMQICAPMVMVADAIHLMDGWENSKGARKEHRLANKLGLEIIYPC